VTATCTTTLLRSKDIHKAHGKPAPKLIGVNRASTLPVFCPPHDSESFAVLERQSFTGNAEQCFLLAYRAVCLEFRKKSNQLKTVDLIKGLDREKPVFDQIAIQLAAYEEAVRVSVRDMERHKLEYDAVLIASDFGKVRAYMVNLDRVPEMLCAGALYPECDFDGRSIGNLADLDRTPELTTFSQVAMDAGGAFGLAFLPSNLDSAEHTSSS
jgi:hypothetical protein